MEEQNKRLMEDTEFRELMKKIEAENAGQERYARKQYQMSRISAAASVLVLVIVIACVGILMPRLLRTFEQVDTVMTDMEAVTSELAESLPEMMTELNGLVDSSGEGITEAIEKVSAIDIDSLNEAIRDLRTVVEPLAKFMR